MKKIDKLVLGSFWGPFFLTLGVVIFIFLMRLLMFYIDEFVSKDLDLATFGRLLFYFSLLTIPTALPLAVLLSSLMTFGNLGEFFELTALKSAGISLTRAMRPLLIVAVGISAFSFWFNNSVAPWANLKGYSLLYDIKTAKATLNLKEGIFYNDLPGYSIKVDRKLKAEKGSTTGDLLKGLVIYKHPTSGLESGNREIILADSGRMYTDKDRTYLVFQLFNGNDYQEYSDNSISYASSGPTPQGAQFMRNGFKDYKLVISLESFGIKRTDENQFEYHEYMKDLKQLSALTDSLRKDYTNTSLSVAGNSRQYYNYQFKSDVILKQKVLKDGKWVDSLLAAYKIPQHELAQIALNQAQNILSYSTSNVTYLTEKEKNVWRYQLESHHKFTQAISVFVMFLIGASMGAIIKKGGFGLPVLIAIVFFIFLYILTIAGDKYAKDGLLWVPIGAWLANIVLFPFGLLLMQRARHDSRLFDKDVYIIAWERLKKRFDKRNTLVRSEE
ncbi:LptF/LptG family permease [Spirosoma fluviale]|uniref:Lipopolysaccharide export system permease protein n=1 Tax=Spirosoma fluviale TaxID=1597977 RepID=A0A286FFA8_9BACT|nr:LptF/LptG family permease [Spirosoma fluviale]SOD81898.1 lipopolysaccharide export system permease protein [Spirosoma fluviale]